MLNQFKILSVCNVFTLGKRILIGCAYTLGISKDLIQALPLLLIFLSSISLGNELMLLHPKAAADNCPVVFEYLDGGKDAKPMTYDETVDRQWHIIGPSYDKLVTDAELRASLPEQDKTFDPLHVAYFEGRNSEGKPDTWMRIVSNTPNLGVAFEGPKDLEPVSGMLPIEKAFPKITPYLDKYHPYRVELGRMETPGELSKRRVGRVAQLFENTLSALQRYRFKDRRKVTILVESLDETAGKYSTLDLYKAFGFEIIDPAEVQKLVPDYELPPGVHVLKLDLDEATIAYIVNFDLMTANKIHRNPYHPEEIRDKIRRADLALRHVPERMQWAVARAHLAKARSHLMLGEAAEAKKALRKADRTPSAYDGSPSLIPDLPEHPETVAMLRLQAEAIERFDPQSGTGSLKEWEAFVADRGERYRKAFNPPPRRIHPLDFYQIWYLAEGGKYTEARALKRRVVAERDRRLEELRKGGQEVGREWDWDEQGNVQAEALTHYFNPETGKGNVETGSLVVNGWMRAIDDVSSPLNGPPFAISPDIQLYRASVLRSQGRVKEAEHVEKVADALTIQ